MAGAESSTRTPPEIVNDAPDQGAALAAFVAQELEQWRFEVRQIGNATLSVRLPGGAIVGQPSAYVGNELQVCIFGGRRPN